MLWAIDDNDMEGVEAWAQEGLRATKLSVFRVALAMLLNVTERALEAFALLSSDPRPEDPYLRPWMEERASAAEAIGRWDDAVRAREWITELDPDGAEAWFELADACRRGGRLSSAVEAAERALELDPGHLFVRGTLGATLALQGHQDEARRVLDDALTIDPAYEFALRERAELGRSVEEAFGFLDRLARLTQDPVDVRLRRGWILLGFDRASEAVAEFHTLLADNPENVELLTMGAQCYLALGNAELAASYARQVLEIQPDGFAGLIVLGRALSAAGNTAEALIYLRRAFEVNGDDADAMGTLAAALRNADEVEEADSVIGQFVLEHPDDAQGFSHQGDHLVTLGYFDEALDPLLTSLDLNPEDAWTHNSLGWAYDYKSEADRSVAIDHFRRALELRPDNLGFRRDLADALHEDGQDAETLYVRVSEQVRANSESVSDWQWVLGWCHFRLGDLARASRHLFAATALPEVAEHARFDLGLVTLCQGDDQQAIELYESTLHLLAKWDPHRTRAPLVVARLELDVACRDWPTVGVRPATSRIAAALDAALRATPPGPQPALMV